MAECFHCGAETTLYIRDIPLCLKCEQERVHRCFIPSPPKQESPEGTPLLIQKTIAHHHGDNGREESGNDTSYNSVSRGFGGPEALRSDFNQELEAKKGQALD